MSAKADYSYGQAVARSVGEMDDAGEVWMRGDNHQLIQPMFVSTFVPVDGKAVKHDLERTGFGLRTDMRLDAKDTVLPTTCRMRRP